MPTEAEWEYVVRAGTTGARYDDVGFIAWYGDNSESSTHPCGTKDLTAGEYTICTAMFELGATILTITTTAIVRPVAQIRLALLRRRIS